MDFQDAEARTVAERRREEERRRRMEMIYKDRVEAASKDMEGKHHVIQLCYCWWQKGNNNNMYRIIDFVIIENWTKYPVFASVGESSILSSSLND